MTQVNVIIPGFSIAIKTDSDELIRLMFERVYPGLMVEGITWSKGDASKIIEGEKQPAECFVRVKNIQTNFQEIIDRLETSQLISQNINRIKQDLSALISTYDKMNKKVVAVPQTSINITESYRTVLSRSPKTGKKAEEEEAISPQDHAMDIKQLIQAISTVTQENIRLRDALALYEARSEASKEAIK